MVTHLQSAYSPQEIFALLKLQFDLGVDEAVTDAPEIWRELAPVATHAASHPTPPVKRASAPAAAPAPQKRAEIQPSIASAIAAARTLADQATTLAELEEAVRRFDGCALKRTASNTVFARGNPHSAVMLIGEAPGAEEDKMGIPFCGPSGQLLDKMMASIGLNAPDGFYITNTIFWRPPGNRQPSAEEIAICKPLVEKHIALIQPKLIVMVGGTATKALLDSSEGITRLRLKRMAYENAYMKAAVTVRATFHPSYLLRQPMAKRDAWQDMLAIRRELFG